MDARELERFAVVLAGSRRSPPAVRAAVVALCACWALWSGCAARPATWRSVADRHWLELRSEAFILSTDLPRPTALERFRELEDARRVLLDQFALVAPGPRPHVPPLHIVHLARCSDLAATSQPTAAVSVTRDRDASGLRLVLACDSTYQRRAALMHEMTYMLTAAHFPRLRPWLVEGLARYYQTLRVENDSVVIGRPPPGHLISARTPRSSAPMMAQRIRYSGAPALETLTSMTDTFYTDARFYNYVGAWKLVHLLNSPPHRGRFVAYLRNLHAGVSLNDAWRAAFGDVGDGIAAQYANYSKRMALQVYRVRRTAPAAFRDPIVTSLRPGEVHALWIQLHISGSGTDSVVRNAIREHLSSMVREDPEWTGIQFWRAVQAHHDDARDLGRAERLLRAYAAREPRDLRAWALLVRLGIDRAVPPHYLATGGAVPAGLAAVEPDVRELLRSGDTPSALNLVGWYYALRRLPRTGLAFAFRAVRADPSCGSCFDTLALLLYEDGRVSDAVAAQERAVMLMAERGPGPDVWRRLDLFRRARRNQAGMPR